MSFVIDIYSQMEVTKPKMCCNVRKCKVKSTSPKVGVKVIEFYLLCFVVLLMFFELVNPLPRVLISSF
jgi:hypothetical protein